MLARLRLLNALDLELWEHAQTITTLRLKLIAAVTKHVKSLRHASVANHTIHGEAGAHTGGSNQGEELCVAVESRLPLLTPLLASQVGIFRPPGHKGPLDNWVF